MQSQTNTSLNLYFKTSDISFCAAALASKKVQLVGTQRISSYRFEFYLSPLEICHNLHNDYINNKLILSAKEIADNVRLLKSLMKGT